MSAPMRVGVVGVGAISDTFISNIKHRFSSLELVGCAARDPESVRAKAAEYSIKAMTMDELMDDPSIEMVINLTPVEAHIEVIERALRAGKHVYSEKALSPDYPSARRLARLADEGGLRLGCAPDTFLGAGVQTAAEAIAAGRIGQPTAFTIVLNRGLDLLYEMLPFLLRPGAGMGYDFGVYGITAVLSILGPAAEVCGFQHTSRPHRIRRLSGEALNGQPYEIDNENVVAATVRLESGVLGTMLFNGDSVFPERPFITVQGTEGLIFLPNPNEFGGEVWLTPRFTDPRQIMDGGAPAERLAVHHQYSDDCRGLGAAEMVDAIRTGRRHRSSAELACHVLELLDGIVESSRTSRYHQMHSTFTPPRRLEGTETF